MHVGAVLPAGVGQHVALDLWAAGRLVESVGWASGLVGLHRRCNIQHSHPTLPHVNNQPWHHIVGKQSQSYTHLIIGGALRGREDGSAVQAGHGTLPQAGHTVSLQGERGEDRGE